MKKKRFNLIVISLSVLVGACVQKYDPPAVTTDLGILVVDGFLNNGPDTTFIRLSRSKKLQDGLANAAELSAFVTVETEDGTVVYNLQTMFNGTYFAQGLNLGAGIKYHLHILTSDGREYRSDDVVVKQTPAIDSISWKQTGEGVTIYANTHDPGNDTRYYRWDYTDTYKFISRYNSSFRYEDGVMYPRTADEQVFECWKTDNSTSILLGTSAKLSQDIITLSPIKQIANNGIEISQKYSILLHQYALTKAAFEYYENLKKITEQLGSIFDAQPSQLSGNIHSLTNSSEVVLGFVTASTLQSKRIFIDHTELNAWNYPFFCEDPISVDLVKVDFWFGKGSSDTPIDEIRDPFTGVLLGYTGAQTGCVDCTSRGGKNVKPDFWP